MKNIISSLLLFVFCVFCCLGGCNYNAMENTLPSTTRQPIQIQRPTKVTVEMQKMGAIIARLAEDPVPVELDNSGSMIDLNFLAWPTITQDENGTLYAAASLRRGHIDPFGATAFFKSTDGGTTWTEPRIIHDSPVDDRDVGLLYIGDGKMVATFFTIGHNAFLPGGQYQNRWDNCTPRQKQAKLSQWNSYTSPQLIGFNGYFLMTSDDYGQTWSEPIRVPFSCPHGPALMNDGKTLICSTVRSNNMFCTYISRDYGKTWTVLSETLLPLPQEDYSYSEPHILQLSDGSFLAGIRLEPFHSMDEKMTVLTMTSPDGLVWTDAEPIPSLEGAPPHFLELRNGVVVMSYTCRVGNYGVHAILSYDGGKTWTETPIVLSNNTEIVDLGYPATVELDDGTLYTVYYQPLSNDRQASLLYTKWTLSPDA